MPILNCYVDDETMERLQRAARDGRGDVEMLAESAISEAALAYSREMETQIARQFDIDFNSSNTEEDGRAQDQ